MDFAGGNVVGSAPPSRHAAPGRERISTSDDEDRKGRRSNLRLITRLEGKWERKKYQISTADAWSNRETERLEASQTSLESMW
ncbi:hypothetical protein KXD40_004467 [Peronospora effusa]|uniref:Uncharacterized protein n=1 Tax=Peronospora effusa TaxID=542832 RepID=A0A3M6VH62_9STRA|nr:hypothetical protein DD238_005401 [Peronospora effusa]UIZ27851.1 hypothetical protein KXD40_004467 [Peronospora effusa]